MACVTSSKIESGAYKYESKTTDSSVEETYLCDGNGVVQFTKYNVYTDTLRHGEHVIEEAIGYSTNNLKELISRILLLAKRISG